MTLLAPQVDTGSPRTDDSGLMHVVCYCDLDTALCGEDVSDVAGLSPVAQYPHDCVVCADLEKLSCPGCGY